MARDRLAKLAERYKHVIPVRDPTEDDGHDRHAWASLRRNLLAHFRIVAARGELMWRKCARALRNCPQRAVGFGGADQVDPDPTGEGWRDEEDEHLPSDEDFEDEEHE